MPPKRFKIVAPKVKPVPKRKTIKLTTFRGSIAKDNWKLLQRDVKGRFKKKKPAPSPKPKGDFGSRMQSAYYMKTFGFDPEEEERKKRASYPPSYLLDRKEKNASMYA